MRLLLALLLAFFMTACASPVMTARAERAAPQYGAGPCAQAPAAPSSDVTYGVAYGIGPNDYARATLKTVLSPATCGLTFLSKVARDGVEALDCLAQTIPVNPEASLYAATVMPAPRATAPPCATQAEPPCQPKAKPVVLPYTAPPAKAPCPPPIADVCTGDECLPPQVATR